MATRGQKTDPLEHKQEEFAEPCYPSGVNPPKNDKARVLINALWSLSGFLTTTIVMFAAVRIYIGQLGLASYGIFTLAMSVLGIAELGGSFP